jgi:hypothetical protein
MLAGVAAALLFGALASVGAALSPSSPGAAAKQYPKKVTICHHTHSKKHPFVTIRISVRALKAHLKHGDTMGPCSQSKKHKKKGKHGKHNGEQPQQVNQSGGHPRHKGKPEQSPAGKNKPKHANANGTGKPANAGANGNQGQGKPDAGKPTDHPGHGHGKK